MLKKQARKARAEQLVKCCLGSGKKKTKRKPLTELFVRRHFTKDREEWQQELQPHCEEVYTDKEETNEIQAEIKVDLVLQARVKMSDNKVNGPDDAIVSEMIKKLPLEKLPPSLSVFRNASWARWNLQVHGRSS